MPRVLGLDYGERRLGFSVSDPSGTMALPHAVREHRGTDQALRLIQEMCRETGAERLVVGLPLSLDGTPGPAAQAVLQLVETLASRLDIPVDTWDERFTTKTAEDVLIEAGTRRKRRRGVVDKLAAQIMLQNYLDAKNREA
jgi:putative Holliday junction resolvase